MCSTPVTLGGGMTMEYAGRSSLTRSGLAVKHSFFSQNEYHFVSTDWGS